MKEKDKRLTAEQIKEKYCKTCQNEEKCKKENADVTKCILSTF